MSRLLCHAVCAALALSVPSPSLWGQEREGSPGIAAAGGALGLTAGAMMGNVGMILPCTQTTLGARCVAGSTIIGGTIGLATGVMVGAEDVDTVIDRAASGLVGFGVGAVIVLAGRPLFQRVGLEDALAVGLFGGAIGTQPRSALVGALAGAGLGSALWQTLPGFEEPDVIAALLAGTMIGVLAGWIGDAADTRSSPGTPIPLFTVRLPS